MKYKQQNQTKKFFEKDAKNWSKKSDFQKNKILNTIQERNFYVLNQLKKYNLNSLLDIGCGSGDLSYSASKILGNSVGIDFSESMIKIAKKKYKNNNLIFENKDFFNFKINKQFDCLSANGFIEYLSIKDIVRFLRRSKEILKKNGLIVFGSRNRLFNLYSLNKFSLNELSKKTFNNLYEESISLCNLNFDKFIKLKKSKFNEVPFKQPKTGINVDLRHQFSPLQIIDILKKEKFKTLDIFPINYHPVPPLKFKENINYKNFSNLIYNVNDKNKLPYIPFSSSFMVTAKNL